MLGVQPVRKRRQAQVSWPSPFTLPGAESLETASQFSPDLPVCGPGPYHERRLTVQLILHASAGVTQCLRGIVSAVPM